MKAELVDKEPVKKDVLLRLSHEEAEELITFIGGTSEEKRRSLCSNSYDDSVIRSIYDSVYNLVPSRCR